MSVKIVVLDDDTDILNVVETILTIYKYKCYPVNDWNKLPEKIKEVKPDLILVDMHLPGDYAHKICKKLAINKSTRLIPVIMFSGDDSCEELYASFNAVAFIKKPFEVKNLLTTIKAHIPISLQGLN